MRLKILFSLLILILTFSSISAFSAFTEEEAVEIPSFSDVNQGDKYYVAITYLKENGIINGYEDGTFRAEQDIDRAQALKMLTLASGVFSEENLEEDLGERPFQDTPLSEWYTKYLAAAKEKGIISGYDDKTFKPWKNINLAEALKIFLNGFEDIDYESALAKEDSYTTDTPEGEWFTKYTAYAISKGLINIYSDNTINPTQTMTRGYLAEIIYRMEMSKDGYEFGKATWYGAATQGHKTASGEIFDYNLMTAAHKYLPFGTIIEVTNLANGKSVQVSINDRGPYGYGRVLDLSSGAFKEIASLGSGIINVQYKIVHLP